MRYIPLSGVVFGSDEPITFQLENDIEIVFKNIQYVDTLQFIEKFSSDDVSNRNLMKLRRSTAEIQWNSNNTEKAIRYGEVLSFWIVSIFEIVSGNVIDHPVYSDTSMETIKSAEKGSIFLKSFEESEIYFQSKPVILSASEIDWAAKKLNNILDFTKKDGFLSALKAYRTMFRLPYPSTSIAVGWTGLESIFGINSELSFRISLLVAKYLEDNPVKQRSIFENLRKSYAIRSKIVHGNSSRNYSEIDEAMVIRGWLQKCLYRAIENNGLPDETELLFAK